MKPVIERALVCGGRDFKDLGLMRLVLFQWDIRHLISGHAPGADTLAEAIASERGIPISVFPADWDRLGRRAGPIRNQHMIDEGRPTFVISFPGGFGTADMIRRALVARIPVHRVDHNYPTTI